MSAAQYPLARAGHELKRLALQAELLKPITRRTFEDAGIGPGMRVLDVGSGSGDVSMLLGEIAGPAGSVTGLEIDPASVEAAEKRVAEAGCRNISFAASDLAHFAPTHQFDAIAGRMVLMYQANPAAALAAVVKHLRPGGIVVFQEPWMMPPGGPDCTLKTCLGLIFETFRRCGTHTDLGLRLHSVFTRAGLAAPQMRMETLIDGREDTPLRQYFIETLASVRPKAVELEIPGARELNPETDGARAVAEMHAFGYAMMALPVVSAWCRR